MTVLWDAMATGAEEAPSYQKVYDRVSKSSGRLRLAHTSLKTATGRKCFEERIAVLAYAVRQIAYELGIEDHPGIIFR